MLWHTTCSSRKKLFNPVFIPHTMNKLTLPLLCLGVFLLSGCKKESNGSQPEPGTLITPRIAAQEETTSFSGALEIYPCKSGTTLYYGNYYNSQLSIVDAMYTIANGSVSTVLRPMTLPIGEYNLIYWGVSQAQQGESFAAGAVRDPSISINQDLSTQSYTLRKYSGSDTTYYPVYDFVFATQPVDIGAQDIAVSLHRVVAGLTVVLQKDDNTQLDAEIASISAMVGGVSNGLNFATGEPTGQPWRTVRFPLSLAEDNMTAANPVVLLFPTTDNPPLTVVLTLRDGTTRTYRSTLANTLSANTKLTVTINIGTIFDAETDAGGFEVNQWDEKTETITPTAES